MTPKANAGGRRTPVGGDSSRRFGRRATNRRLETPPTSYCSHRDTPRRRRSSRAATWDGRARRGPTSPRPTWPTMLERHLYCRSLRRPIRGGSATAANNAAPPTPPRQERRPASRSSLAWTTSRGWGRRPPTARPAPPRGVPIPTSVPTPAPTKRLPHRGRRAARRWPRGRNRPAPRTGPTAADRTADGRPWAGPHPGPLPAGEGTPAAYRTCLCDEVLRQSAIAVRVVLQRMRREQQYATAKKQSKTKNKRPAAEEPHARAQSRKNIRTFAPCRLCVRRRFSVCLLPCFLLLQGI